MSERKVEVKIGENTYTIESNQGIVVRKNGALLADFADGKWEWVNPNVSVEQTDLDALVSTCKKFEELRYYSPKIVPCECGSADAYWHGPEDGLREYCCDFCWRKKNGF